MHTLSISLFDWSFDGDNYKAKRRGTQSFAIGDQLSIIRNKLARLYGDVETAVRSAASYAYRDLAMIEQAESVQAVGVVKIDNINSISIINPIFYCASRRLGYSRKETVWQVTERNAEPAVVQRAKYEKCKQIVTFPVVISRLFNAVRSGVAGAVALGSAYAVSIPQKTNADLIQITSFTNFVDNANTYDPVNYPGRAVEYSSQIFVDGQAPTNRLLLLLTRDYPEYNSFNLPIGGLNGTANSSSVNGFISYDNTSNGGIWAGLTIGQTPNTPINGFSGGWQVYEDVNNDGIFGTLDTATGVFTYERFLSSTISAAFPYVTTTNMSVHGFNPFPESGTGPLNEGVFDINIVPEPSILTISDLSMSSQPTMALSNSAPGTMLFVQRSDDLMSTNWLNITNFLTGYTNWTDTTATGDWSRLFYRVAQ